MTEDSSAANRAAIVARWFTLTRSEMPAVAGDRGGEGQGMAARPAMIISWAAR